MPRSIWKQQCINIDWDNIDDIFSHRNRTFLVWFLTRVSLHVNAESLQATKIPSTGYDHFKGDEGTAPSSDEGTLWGRKWTNVWPSVDHGQLDKAYPVVIGIRVVSVTRPWLYRSYFSHRRMTTFTTKWERSTRDTTWHPKTFSSDVKTRVIFNNWRPENIDTESRCLWSEHRILFTRSRMHSHKRSLEHGLVKRPQQAFFRSFATWRLLWCRSVRDPRDYKPCIRHLCKLHSPNQARNGWHC